VPSDPKKTDLGPPAARVTPTVIDAVNPLDAPPRQSPTIAESDPPTALVRRDSFVDLPPGSVVGEIYEIDARLGAGAMGEVYAARHTKLGKRVAIKVIGSRLSGDAAAIERFAMEARTLAQIQHPAIVAVEHVGELADGRAFFVMEYLRGESLFERLQRGRVALPEALRILDQVARGLDAAHAQGVTHRDLKPENIYLVHLTGEAPLVKLLDFGLAKLRADVSDVDRRAECTQSGVALGTPMYMSPEQARGHDVDHRTDVYALGCIAYELVLDRAPFPHARTAPELFAAHLHESPPLPRSIWSEVPPQLDLALFAMLAKNPAHRPTLEQVRSVFADERTSSQRAATEFVVQRPARTSWTLAAIGGVTLMSGVLIGTILSRHAATRDAPIASPPRAAPIASPAPAPPEAAPTAPVTTTVAPRPQGPGSGAPIAAPRHGHLSSAARQPPQQVGSAASTGSATPAEDSAVAAGSVTAPPASEKVPPTASGSNAIDRRRTKNPFSQTSGSASQVDKNQTVNPFAPKQAKGTP